MIVHRAGSVSCSDLFNALAHYQCQSEDEGCDQLLELDAYAWYDMSQVQLTSRVFAVDSILRVVLVNNLLDRSIIDSKLMYCTYCIITAVRTVQ
jgi:hypothetical protein